MASDVSIFRGYIVLGFVRKRSHHVCEEMIPILDPVKEGGHMFEDN